MLTIFSCLILLQLHLILYFMIPYTKYWIPLYFIAMDHFLFTYDSKGIRNLFVSHLTSSNEAKKKEKENSIIVFSSS